MAHRLSSAKMCRLCCAPLRHTLVDLGMIPLCQSYIEEKDLDRGEMFYPLRAYVCMSCYYIGLPEYVSAEEIFTEYAYFSSVSESWIRYVRDSVEELTDEFGLNGRSQVVEMASNDGYLLQFFVQRGIPVLGVEPAANVAKVANDRGVPTLAKFFNLQIAEELKAAGKSADLLLAYNPGAVLLGPDDLPQLGFSEDILAAISKWHVCQRSDAIRTILLATHGGMWCDVDCIPLRRFHHFARLAQTAPSGIAAGPGSQEADADRVIGRIIGGDAGRCGLGQVCKMMERP